MADMNDSGQFSKMIEEMNRSSIWKPVPTADEPETILTGWTIKKVTSESHEGEETYHVMGWTGREGRVSSKLISFDKEYRTAITNSGRRYVLEGDSRYNSDALYVWGRWCAINGVTSEYSIRSDNFDEMVDIKNEPSN